MRDRRTEQRAKTWADLSRKDLDANSALGTIFSAPRLYTADVSHDARCQEAGGRLRPASKMSADHKIGRRTPCNDKNHQAYCGLELFVLHNSVRARCPCCWVKFPRTLRSIFECLLQRPIFPWSTEYYPALTLTEQRPRFAFNIGSTAKRCAHRFIRRDKQTRSRGVIICCRNPQFATLPPFWPTLYLTMFISNLQRSLKKNGKRRPHFQNPGYQPDGSTRHREPSSYPLSITETH